MFKRICILLVLFALLLSPARALAQDYSYSLPQYTANVYWNEDGTVSIDYVFLFQNDPSGHAIEYVDLAMPRDDFDPGSIRADVGGQPVTDISTSGYQGTGSGVAVGLGSYSIPPGESGTVHVFVGRVENMYELDTQNDDYASGVFAPATFLKPYVYGATDLTVTFHLPPAVQPDEPRWHQSPSGFPSEPETGFDDQDRITYTAQPAGRSLKSYRSALFPTKYIPIRPSAACQPLRLPEHHRLGCLFPIGCTIFNIFGLGLIGKAAARCSTCRRGLPSKATASSAAHRP
jgi:hypothetical protein